VIYEVTIRVNGINFGVFRLCGNDELDSFGNADDRLVIHITTVHTYIVQSW